MFTGLVEAVGRVDSATVGGTQMVLAVALGTIAEGIGTGDSIALSGVCCTVAGLEADVARFCLSAETLRRTWLGRADAGTPLNLERSLRAGAPMGGHIVQGHVDGVGEVVRPLGTVDAELGGEIWVQIPRELLPYCVEKGSIALDGVSLTIAALAEDRIMVAVIPHTATVTTIDGWCAGQPVNIEVDVLAKYVERLLAAHLDRG